jgi:hypothetical protein
VIVRLATVERALGADGDDPPMEPIGVHEAATNVEA